MKNRLLSMTLAVGLLFTGQAMATDLLQDDDLDRMSAAGDPVVIDSGNAGGTSTIVYEEQTEFGLVFDQPHAQMGLRALTIQNVVGELQLSVNLNVLSASNNVAGTDQRNFSVQSWGSTLADPDTIKAATATAVANAACSTTFSCAAPGGIAVGGSGAVGASATQNSLPAGNVNTPVIAGNTSTAVNNNQNNAPTGDVHGGAGGAGGSATANAAANGGIIKGEGAVAAVAVVGGTLGGASGDVILRNRCNGTSGSSSAGCSVVMDNGATYNLSFKVSEAQKDLSALFISNVVGRAQMALNLNIAAAALNLIPGSDQSFASPFDNATGVIKQVNTSMQARGTPWQNSITTTVGHLNQ